MRAWRRRQLDSGRGNRVAPDPVECPYAAIVGRGPGRLADPGAGLVCRAGVVAVPVPGGRMGCLRARGVGTRPRADRHGQDLCRRVASHAPRGGRRAGLRAAFVPALDHAAARAGGGHRPVARASRRRTRAALDDRRAHRRHRRRGTRPAGQAAAERAHHHPGKSHAAPHPCRLAAALRPSRGSRRRRMARADGHETRRADRTRACAVAPIAPRTARVGALGNARQSGRRPRLPRRPRRGRARCRRPRGSIPRRSPSTACVRARSNDFRGRAISD